MSGSVRYLDTLESLRALFLDYPMRADMSSIHLSVDSDGQASIMVWLRSTDPVVLAAGIVEWRRTLSPGATWVWRTPDGAGLHVATTGHAPECAGIPVAVLAGPLPHECHLDNDLEPGLSEERDDDALYRWLGDEIAHNWPFPAGTNTTPDGAIV
jgi:hypothetical protein